MDNLLNINLLYNYKFSIRTFNHSSTLHNSRIHPSNRLSFSDVWIHVWVMCLCSRSTLSPHPPSRSSCYSHERDTTSPCDARVSVVLHLPHPSLPRRTHFFYIKFIHFFLYEFFFKYFSLPKKKTEKQQEES